MTALGAADSDLLQTVGQGLRLIVSDAVGAYLHGSTGLQMLKPRSDLDILVVTQSLLTDEQRLRLTDLLLDHSGRRARRGPPARPVELTVVAQEDVRPWRYPPRCDYQYGEWLRDDIVSGSAMKSFVNADLAVALTSVLACDLPLFGPPASEVLDPVPTHDLVASSVAGVPQLREELVSDTTNVLLTLARAWRTAALQDIVPKDVAGLWAMPRLGPQEGPALGHARAVYLGEEEEDWGHFQEVLDTVASDLAAGISGALS